MFDDSRLYLRVDASPEIGAGHFMRCLALAERWSAEGGRGTFVGSFPGPLRRMLDQRGLEHVALGARHPAPQDLRETADLIPPAVPVVLDGYDFDADYQRALRRRERRLAVIDDTGHLPAYDADILVNQNLDAELVPYARAPAIRLLGARYAMLRREFAERSSVQRDVRPIARRILVTMGGADRDNHALEVARVLARSAVDDTRVRIVTGPASPHGPTLRRFAESNGARFEVVSGESGMRALMEWADLAIAAAGSTCFELAFTGLPAVLISVADNQVPIAAGMAARGAALDLGPATRMTTWSDLAPIVHALALDGPRRQGMRASGRGIVDGKGAARVVAALKQRVGAPIGEERGS